MMNKRIHLIFTSSVLCLTLLFSYIPVTHAEQEGFSHSSSPWSDVKVSNRLLIKPIMRNVVPATFLINPVYYPKHPGESL